MIGDARPGFLPVDRYLELPRDRETWLLKPLIPLGGACLLYGSPKTGKSYLGIQLALALSGQATDWLGFPVGRAGKVLYLQLDTPRSLWATRFHEMIEKGKLQYNSNTLLLADRDSIEYCPFDILQPSHVLYLKRLVEEHNPVAVVIDTLRHVHSGDEDSSTVSRNVLANLIGATNPAALILISHSRKPNPEAEKSTLDDHRGSGNIVASMDAILRLTKTRLYYAGRSIEEGNVKLERQENGLWVPQEDAPEIAALTKVLSDPQLPTMRAKGRALATLTGKNEETCVSRVRRAMSHDKLIITDNSGTVNLQTGEVIN